MRRADLAQQLMDLAAKHNAGALDLFSMGEDGRRHEHLDAMTRAFRHVVDISIWAAHQPETQGFDSVETIACLRDRAAVSHNGEWGMVIYPGGPLALGDEPAFAVDINELVRADIDGMLVGFVGHILRSVGHHWGPRRFHA